jgi:membrane protease YdiL (CAAX protease family)
MTETYLAAPPPPEIGVGPKPWGVPAVLGALALPVLIFSSSLAIAIASGPAEDLSEGEIAANLIISIILDIGLILLAAAFSVWHYKLPWSALGLRSFDTRFWWLPIVAAIGALVGITAYSAVLIGIGFDSAVPNQEDLDTLFDSRILLPLTGFALVIAAPIAEEIFFRGFIFGGLIRPLGPGPAMVVSGLIFGSFHVTSPDALGLVLPFAAIGALFAWLYYRTGSILPNIAAHMLFNMIGFAAGAAAGGS